MIPNWIANKRLDTCSKCLLQNECGIKYKILEEAPACPKGSILSVMDEVANKAWPENAPRLSGCCDSALNYGDS
jgi:hypothetical protein